MSQSIRGQGSHIVFRIGLKNTYLDLEIYRLAAVSEEKSKMSPPSRGRAAILFSDRPENTNLVEDGEILIPVKIVKFQRKKSKMSQPISCQGGHIVFRIGPKITNLVEDAEVLLPIKFRWIPFSGVRGEVENVSTNHRPGRPSCFSNRSENTNFVDDIEILLPVNSVQRLH